MQVGLDAKVKMD